MNIVSADTRSLRTAGVAMLAIGAAWNALPMHPPACPLLTATGVPCPFCGATRSAVATLHGDIGTALRWNPIGVLAVAFAVVLIAGWFVRWRPSLLTIAWPIPVAIVGTAWIYNLAWNPNF